MTDYLPFLIGPIVKVHKQNNKEKTQLNKKNTSWSSTLYQ